MATTISTLKFMITADAGGLVEGVALTKKELREASKIAEQSQSPFQQYGDKLDRLKMLHAGGGLDAAQYRQALNGVHQEMLSGIPVIGRFAGLLTPGGAITAGLAAGAAGFLALSGAVAAAGAVVSSRINAIDDLGDAAERLGVSASSLSTIRTAAFLGDVDPAAADGAIKKMLVNVGKGSKAIEELGLSSERLKGMSTAKMFDEIAVAIAKLPNKSDQFAAMTEIFGKSGPEISSLVNKFAELQESALASGAVVSDELAAQVAEADDAMKKASLTAEGWANTLTAVVVPAVTATIEAMDALANNREQAGKAVGGVLGILGGIVAGPSGVMTGNLYGRLGTDAAMDLRDEQIAAARASKEKADAERDLAAANDDVAESTGKALDAERRHAEALGKTLQAMRDELQTMAMTRAERAAFNMARAGGDTAHQEEAEFLQDELDFAKQKKKVEDDAFRNNIKNQEQELQRSAQIKESLKTDKERAADAMREAGGMRARGLLTDADVNAIARREAAGLTRGLESQAGVGFAEKGSAAARQAVIESKQVSRQVELLEQIAESLRKAATAEPIVIKEIGE
jgi:hypothetical protein